MARKGPSDLGFCIGLTSLRPDDALEKGCSGVRTEAFFAGGDCAFHIRGERVDAGESSDSGGSYITVPPCGLRKGDRVGLLAEWSGCLTLYLNGDLIRYSISAR